MDRTEALPTFRVGNDLFLRSVGLCYLVAFASLWIQVDGLVGSRGILPIGEFLDYVRRNMGPGRFALLPTLCWLDSSDGFLHFLCGGGMLAALGVVAGFFPAAALFVCWAFYLSLCVAGQVFLEFQWDALLLEAGLLALLSAPLCLRLRRAAMPPPSVAVWLQRWLLFRLMFSSGFVKLSSGDAAWSSLTALRRHYETQPLPPWTAWFMHQLPPWFQTASCAVMFAIELVVPFFIFGPRRLRLVAFWTFLAFQAAIASTGNYAFFNMLAAALAWTLVDDASFPERWRRLWPAPAEASPRRRFEVLPAWALAPFAAVIGAVSAILMWNMVLRPASWPAPVVSLVRAVAPFRSVNGYGLFAVMTIERPEIVLEGSDDGEEWKPYTFPWKPGDPMRRPRFVAPHQPRLDWQMWFAALQGYGESPWLERLEARLLEGSPPVLRLFSGNPFPGHPPRYIRPILYDYRFTDFAQRRATGAWWRREERGPFGPVLSSTPRSAPDPR